MVFLQTISDLHPRAQSRAATAAPEATRPSQEWDNRVTGQQLRNQEIRENRQSTHPDQGIGFNEDGCPVDKATTPREVWDRRWNSEPPPQRTYGIHRSLMDYCQYDDNGQQPSRGTSYTGYNPLGSYSTLR